MRKGIATFISMLLGVALLSSCASPQTAGTGAPPSDRPSESARQLDSELTPSPTPEPKVYQGTTVLVMGAAEADFGKNKPVHPNTHLLLFIDPANGNLTVLSLPAQLAVDALDKDGAAAVRMPLNEVCYKLGADAVAGTLEARLDIQIDKMLSVNGDMAVALLKALGPVSFDVPAEMLANGAIQQALKNLGYEYGAKAKASVPKEAGNQLLDTFQFMAVALGVPEDVYAGKPENIVAAEELCYRANRILVVKALAAAIAGIDAEAMAKTFIDNKADMMTDSADDEIAGILGALKECCAGDVALLQLPLGDITAAKEGDMILLEGAPAETEREELHKLLVR